MTIKKTFVFVMAVLMCQIVFSQREYEILIPQEPKEIITGHLNLGGSNPAGELIDFNSFYMSINGKPFIPVMGEIHYSRIPHQYWEEQILKMKAGGINVIATYVFWCLHEWEEGVFDWTGDNDLRAFLSLCQKHNLFTVVRIGPFCHGDIRNGGLPDWLYGRPFEIRSNDEGYLFYVKRLYHNIARQMQGMYYKDGGVIIGIQLENELQHSAAPWTFSYLGQKPEYTVANYDTELTHEGVSVEGRQSAYAKLGSDHMANLKKFAVDEGMLVPLYTATGWGNAAILENEMIPVCAAYAYPYWGTPTTSEFYLFKDVQKSPDYIYVRYDGTKYPSFYAEMGSGTHTTYLLRPRIPAKSVEALAMRILGSGSNGLGYYMYHGGLTPQGEGGMFLSDEPTGQLKISYDYQAPLGAYGKARDSYFNLRIINLFADNFGDRLAPMGLVLPETNAAITPDDNQTLRYTVRSNGKAGFVFLLNFQDHYERIDQQIKGLNVQLANETIQFPAFTLKKDASAILPFNMSINAALLKYATVQPLAVSKINGKEHYFFFAHDGISPEFVFDKAAVKNISGKKSDKNGKIHITPVVGLSGSFTVTDINGNEVIITTLSREQALNFNLLPNSICITDATLMQNGSQIQLQSLSNKFTVVLPAGTKPDFGNYKTVSKKSGLFTAYEVEVPAVQINFEAKEVSRQRHTFQMDKKEFTENLSDIILMVDYVADTGAAFIDGRMINDNLYNGNLWQMGLKQYADRLSENGMSFYFRPIASNAPCLIDFSEDVMPVFDEDNTACKVNSMKVIPEYFIRFQL